MNKKPRLERKIGISIVGLIALGLVSLSQTRLSANQPPAAGLLFSAPTGWTEEAGHILGRGWKGEADRKAYVSVIEDGSMKAETPIADDRQYVEIMQSASAIPNFIAGVHDWKVEKLERIQIPQGYKVVLTGTYLNSVDEKIRFEEWKYYLKDGYGQINYSELAGPKARGREQVAEILKRYHPFGT